MYSEITSILLGHTLLGAILAISALAMAFWLLLAFRSARAAIQNLSSLNQALQATPELSPALQTASPRHTQGRAS
jgi:hypothetical protein